MQEHSSYEEKDLLLQVAEGGETAFRELFYQYRPRLIAFVLGLSKREQSAEDVVHDIFLDLWKNRELLREIPYFKSH